MLPFYEKNRPFRGSVSQGMFFPAHLHANLECVYMLSGEQSVRIRETEYRLCEGDFALILPGTLHAFLAHSDDCCLQLVLCAPVLCGAASERLWYGTLKEPILRREAVHPDIVYAMQAVIAEGEVSDDSKFDIRAALMQLILARVLPALALHRGELPKSERLLSQIVQYIGEHFRERLTLTDLAEALHISPSHLSHVFSDKIGMRFPRYLTEFRLDYAASRIRSSEQSLTDIWLEAGFESQCTFNRAFRRAYGMTPRTYRTEKRMPR